MNKITAGLTGFAEAHKMLTFVEWKYDSSTFWATAAPWQKAIALQRSWGVLPECIPGYWAALGNNLPSINEQRGNASMNRREGRP